MRRREFIHASAAAMAGMLAVPALGEPAAKKNKIGIQLYTYNDVLNDDPKGIVRQLASFGYKELETFGYQDGKLFGLTVSEFGNEVKALGMQTVSGHFGIDLGRTDWERTVADATAVGRKYACVAWLADDD